MKLEDFLTPAVAEKMKEIDKIRALIAEGAAVMLTQEFAEASFDKQFRVRIGCHGLKIVVLPRLIRELEALA